MEQNLERELSADEILGTEDLQPVPHKVPEWGGTVYIRQLSAAEGIKLAEFIGSKTDKGANAKVVAMCLCDKKGNRLFSHDQVERVQSKNLRVVNEVAQRCLVVNGIVKDKNEAAKAEADTKND